MQKHVCTWEALTLTLVGTLRCGRLPLLLVEAGAAALTGAPTRVVLAGALQPVGHTAQRAQIPQRKRPEEAEAQGLRRWVSWAGY